MACFASARCLSSAFMMRLCLRREIDIFLASLRECEIRACLWQTSNLLIISLLCAWQVILVLELTTKRHLDMTSINAMYLYKRLSRSIVASWRPRAEGCYSFINVNCQDSHLPVRVNSTELSQQAFPRSKTRIARGFYLRSILTFTLVLPLVHTASATPIPLNISDWLRGQLLPSPGQTLAGEIKCYNLPYGGIGFLSHILTYYTVTMLLLGRTPLLPSPGEVIKNGGFDCFLSGLGMVGSVVVAGFNISACRFRWQFVCIGVWKLVLSFTLCVISFHQSVYCVLFLGDYSPDAQQHELQNDTLAVGWLCAYITGTVVGMVGLLSLVAQLFHEQVSIRVVTGVFASLALFPFIVSTASALIFVLIRLWFYIRYFVHVDDTIGNYEWKFRRNLGLLEITLVSLTTTPFLFGLLCAFYCDWILAAIAGNWAGLPSSDIAVLYWIYFAAKRLPMLST